MTCSPSCTCMDFHGLTASGIRYPIANRPKCLVCGSTRNIREDLCFDCATVMDEAAQLLASCHGETVEARRILRHARFYVQHRWKYWGAKFCADAEQSLVEHAVIRSAIQMANSR